MGTLTVDWLSSKEPVHALTSRWAGCDPRPWRKGLRKHRACAEERRQRAYNDFGSLDADIKVQRRALAVVRPRGYKAATGTLEETAATALLGPPRGSAAPRASRSGIY
jgi:hypothetical protein